MHHLSKLAMFTFGEEFTLPNQDSFILCRQINKQNCFFSCSSFKLSHSTYISPVFTMFKSCIILMTLYIVFPLIQPSKKYKGTQGAKWIKHLVCNTPLRWPSLHFHLGSLFICRDVLFVAEGPCSKIDLIPSSSDYLIRL